MLHEFQFGPEGLAWVRQCLSAGSTLSKTLLDLSLEKGRVFTYLPNGLNAGRHMQFKFGGIFSSVGEKIGQTWPKFISEYLAGPAERYCILEDISAPSDPGLDSSDEQFFVYETEVYDFLSSQDTDVEKIRSILSCGRQYPSIGALTRLSGLSELQHRHSVKAEVLQLLASNTQYILVGAYDEESYLVWSRAGLE